MVPVVSAEDGAWLLEGALSPMLKPGGHGALWKLMEDEGEWEGRARDGRRVAVGHTLCAGTGPAVHNTLHSAGCALRTASHPLRVCQSRVTGSYHV